jgi:inner membrane transporter RhtA
VPFSLEFVAMRHIPRRVFAVLVTLEPVIAAVVGFLVLHEVLSVLQCVAMVCVVAAALGSSREMLRKKSHGEYGERDGDLAGAGAGTL